jgi:hypothetical protein
MTRWPTFGHAVHPKPLAARYVAGLDLGQATDYTALAMVQRVAIAPEDEVDPDDVVDDNPAQAAAPGVGEPFELHCCGLMRFALGTPYPVIISKVVKLMNTRPFAGRTRLLVDAVGVGRPILASRRLEPGCSDRDGWNIGLGQ